jgi:small subunit ribosomal protein S1
VAAPVAEIADGVAVEAADVAVADVPAVEVSDAPLREVAAAAEPIVTETGETESPVAAAESTTAAEASPDPEVVPEPASFRYQPGDIVPGHISVVGANGIEADLGDGDTAVIPRSEIDGDPVVGEAVEGTVIKHQAGTGRYVISPKRAAKARAWTRIVEAFESKTPMTGKVTDATKGGLIVDLGVRAFLPESLIDVRKPHNPRSLIGTEVTVMVVEAEKLSGDVAAQERRSEKVVVNRRILRETERKAQRDRLLTTLQAGDRMVGTVTALTDFGAFVDLGGAEGLVHVSELAHRNVAKPGDVVKVGQEIDVIVIEVKADRGKISLSHKATLASPWQQLKATAAVGDLVYGIVSGVAPFGAFVTVEGDGFVVEGLIHISELSRFRVEEASEVVNVGEGVWTKILAIEPEKRRLSLSLRRALEE